MFWEEDKLFINQSTFGVVKEMAWKVCTIGAGGSIGIFDGFVAVDVTKIAVAVLVVDVRNSIQHGIVSIVKYVV